MVWRGKKDHLYPVGGQQLLPGWPEVVGNEPAPPAQALLGLNRESWHLGLIIPWSNIIKPLTSSAHCRAYRHSKKFPSWINEITWFHLKTYCKLQVLWNGPSLGIGTNPIKGRGKGRVWKKHPARAPPLVDSRLEFLAGPCPGHQPHQQQHRGIFGVEGQVYDATSCLGLPQSLLGKRMVFRPCRWDEGRPESF